MKYSAFRLVEDLRHLLLLHLDFVTVVVCFSFPGETGREKDARETSLVKERIHEPLSRAKSLCTCLHPPPSFASTPLLSCVSKYHAFTYDACLTILALVLYIFSLGLIIDAKLYILLFLTNKIFLLYTGVVRFVIFIVWYLITFRLKVKWHFMFSPVWNKKDFPILEMRHDTLIEVDLWCTDWPRRQVLVETSTCNSDQI